MLAPPCGTRRKNGRRKFLRHLYRNALLAVISAGVLLSAGAWLAAQPTSARKQAADKGPRALALIQIASQNGKPKGKARLIPVAIMMDGKFYDAGAYKASPVPLALDFGVVYEAFRAGVSQGVFTITQPGQLNHDWIAEGTWVAAGDRPSEKRKKYSAPVIDDDRDDRPVLHRRAPKEDESAPEGEKEKREKNKTATDISSSKPVSEPAATPSASPPASASPTSASSTTAPPPSASSERTKSSAAPDEEPPADPNRPRLRRGKPDLNEHHEPFVTFDAPLGATSASGSTSNPAEKTAFAKGVSPTVEVVTIPAISDAASPDPRAYTYDLKPAEEAIYRNKMVELATTQLLVGAKAAETKGAANKLAPRPGHAGKPAKPDFENINLRIFDLSNSNEPVLVMAATVRPSAAAGNAQPEEVTLIARTNLEGEVQKLFFTQTDARHLDVTPRMELIDAVDADGDGRGELLFRRTFEGGSAYAIYRVTADGLWPLFEGTP